MKLKRPITDTKELLEIAFPLVSAITAAGASDGDIASVGAALIMLISEIERADGKEENGIPQPCGVAPFRQGGPERGRNPPALRGSPLWTMEPRGGEQGIPQPCGAAPFRQGGRRGDGAFHGRGEE